LPCFGLVDDPCSGSTPEACEDRLSHGRHSAASSRNGRSRSPSVNDLLDVCLCAAWAAERDIGSLGRTRTRHRPVDGSVQRLLIFESHVRPSRIRDQNRKDDLFYLACDLDGLGLIARQHLGSIAGIANLHTERSQPFRGAQGVRDGATRAPRPGSTTF
jgi:hypothetical protein